MGGIVRLRPPPVPTRRRAWRWSAISIGSDAVVSPSGDASIGSSLLAEGATLELGKECKVICVLSQG